VTGQKGTVTEKRKKVSTGKEEGVKNPELEGPSSGLRRGKEKTWRVVKRPSHGVGDLPDEPKTGPVGRATIFTQKTLTQEKKRVSSPEKG